jgi:hypothetical protein
MTRIIISEKPSMGRAIAAALGIQGMGRNFIQGADVKRRSPPHHRTHRLHVLRVARSRDPINRQGGGRSVVLSGPGLRHTIHEAKPTETFGE